MTVQVISRPSWAGPIKNWDEFFSPCKLSATETPGHSAKTTARRHLLKSNRVHPFTIRSLLSLPAKPMIPGLISGDPEVAWNARHSTMEFPVRLMILTMMDRLLVRPFRRAANLSEKMEQLQSDGAGTSDCRKM